MLVLICTRADDEDEMRRIITLFADFLLLPYIDIKIIKQNRKNIKCFIYALSSQDFVNRNFFHGLVLSGYSWYYMGSWINIVQRR